METTLSNSAGSIIQLSPKGDDSRQALISPLLIFRRRVVTDTPSRLAASRKDRLVEDMEGVSAPWRGGLQSREKIWRGLEDLRRLQKTEIPSAPGLVQGSSPCVGPESRVERPDQIDGDERAVRPLAQALVILG